MPPATRVPVGPAELPCAFVRRATIAALLVVLLCAGCVGARDVSPGTGPGAGPATSASRTALVDPADVRVALDRRAAAISGRQRTAYLASGGDAVLYDRLARLPLAHWSYDPITVRLADGLATVTVRWRLDGDDGDTATRTSVAVTASGSGVRVGPDVAVGLPRPAWASGTLAVVRGTRSVVVGVAGPGEVLPTDVRLRAWAAAADRAVRTVAEVVPDGWRRRITVYVPASVAGAGALADRSATQLRTIAAVTIDAGVGAPGGPLAARVVVNPLLLDDAHSLVARIVLTHEITHAALGAARTTATPLWLEEGYATLVGYRDSGVTLPIAAREALTAAPMRVMPSAADFAGGDSAIAYARSMLACELLQRRLGWAGLLTMYRNIARGADRSVPTDLVSATEVLVRSL